MRLDKYLAHAGLGTRKEVKLAIRKGRVSAVSYTHLWTATAMSIRVWDCWEMTQKPPST